MVDRVGRFQVSDIEGLSPGQILYWDGKNVVGSMDDFEKAATSSC